MIDIIIVDDHHIVRDGITRVLNRDSHLNVIASIGSINELYLFLEYRQPNLILLDLKLEDGDGISASVQLKKLYPKIKIIILSGFIEPHLALEAKRIGLEGYLLKTISIKRLIEAIDSVMKGQTAYDPDVEKQSFNPITEILSPQENQIIYMMSLGKTNKEIANELSITEKTVRNYANRLFKKLNVTNRTEAVSAYFRQQIINGD